MSSPKHGSLPLRTLGFGRFFGDPEFGRELPGISLKRVEARRPPPSVPDHQHETAHAILVLEGAYVTTATRIEPGRAPRLVYNPPGTTHRDRFRDPHGSFFALSLTERVLRAWSPGPLPAAPVAFSSGRSVRLARRIARMCESWPPARTSRVEGLCVDLLAGLHDHSRAPAPDPPAWLAACQTVLESRFAEPIRLRELAGEFAVHPVHLIRAFRRFYGCTPGVFVRERRLSAAAVLLRTTNLPIVEIALRAGFADQSHFTHAFRRKHRDSPALYRRRFSG